MKKDKNIAKIISTTPSRWRENAEYRLQNRWLRYSSEIARRILAVIDDNSQISQTSLAERLGVSKQRISTIVKGNENLTLETIYNLEQALSVKLIIFPEYKYSTSSSLLFQSHSDAYVAVSLKMILDCDGNMVYGENKMLHFKGAEHEVQFAINNIKQIMDAT